MSRTHSQSSFLSLCDGPSTEPVALAMRDIYSLLCTSSENYQTLCEQYLNKDKPPSNTRSLTPNDRPKARNCLRNYFDTFFNEEKLEFLINIGFPELCAVAFFLNESGFNNENIFLKDQSISLSSFDHTAKIWLEDMDTPDPITLETLNNYPETPPPKLIYWPFVHTDRYLAHPLLLNHVRKDKSFNIRSHVVFLKIILTNNEVFYTLLKNRITDDKKLDKIYRVFIERKKSLQLNLIKTTFFLENFSKIIDLAIFMKISFSLSIFSTDTIFQDTIQWIVAHHLDTNGRNVISHQKKIIHLFKKYFHVNKKEITKLQSNVHSSTSFTSILNSSHSSLSWLGNQLQKSANQLSKRILNSNDEEQPAEPTVMELVTSPYPSNILRAIQQLILEKSEPFVSSRDLFLQEIIFYSMEEKLTKILIYEENQNALLVEHFIKLKDLLIKKETISEVCALLKRHFLTIKITDDASHGFYCETDLSDWEDLGGSLSKLT